MESKMAEVEEALEEAGEAWEKAKKAAREA